MPPAAKHQLRACYQARAGTEHLTVGHQRTMAQAVRGDLVSLGPLIVSRVDTEAFCHWLEMAHLGPD